MLKIPHIIERDLNEIIEGSRSDNSKKFREVKSKQILNEIIESMRKAGEDNPWKDDNSVILWAIDRLIYERYNLWTNEQA